MTQERLLVQLGDVEVCKMTYFFTFVFSGLIELVRGLIEKIIYLFNRINILGYKRDLRSRQKIVLSEDSL